MIKGSVLNPSNSVTRSHRTAFVLLLDLSGSMMEPVMYGVDLMTKSAVLSDVSNKILQEFYMRSFRDNEICDYYDIAVLGYSGDKVYSLLNDDVNDPFVSIKVLGDSCKGRGLINLYSVSPLNSPELVELMSDSTICISACGATPMYEALGSLHRAVDMWCLRPENYDSHPPMVFHITDGHPTDSDLRSIVDISNKIKSVRTNCGEVLLLNIKFDSEVSATPLLFPTDAEVDDYPCAFVRAMARSSSLMPESFTPMINDIRELRCVGGYRGFGCNISVADMISMLNIGTLSVVVQ